MNATMKQSDSEAPEMSVVGPTFEEETEVKTMTTSTAVAASGTTHQWLAEPSPVAVQATSRPIRSSSEYTRSERLVAGIGLALLSWSNRRWSNSRRSNGSADHAQLTHARMALILENESVRAAANPARPLGSN